MSWGNWREEVLSGRKENNHGDGEEHGCSIGNLQSLYLAESNWKWEMAGGEFESGINQLIVESRIRLS